LLPDKNVKCPYTGFNKTCFEGVTEHQCPKWIHIMGADPNTGETVNKYACSDAWTPMLLIENSQQQRQTAAAVEGLRNVVAEVNSGPPLLPREAMKLING
jgi:hypothetical protein